MRNVILKDLQALQALHGLSLITTKGVSVICSGQQITLTPFSVPMALCKGACVGGESLATHSARLIHGLSKLRLRTWPFGGPAYLKEGAEVLVIDNWCYLGAARSDEELWPLLDERRPQFDRDTYRILSKVVSRMQPLAARGGIRIIDDSS